MGQVLNLARRLNKVRAMSLEEIAHRSKYALFLASERRTLRRGEPPADRLRTHAERSSPWPDALLDRRVAHGRGFFPSLQHPDETRRVLKAEYASEVGRTLHDADAVLRHEFAFFGRTFQYEARIDWHADPISGRQWPQTFHADVPVHGGDVGFGDVKYVWELNRHQFLIDLGKAYFITADRRYLDEITSIVKSWTTANPVGVGVNWACALEPAFRSLSWLWAYHFCLQGGQLEADDHVLWLASLQEHGSFLYRHLELHSSPYNHLAVEAAALFALGLLFPEFVEAEQWRRRGREVLESRVQMQFHADGGSVEQSTFYHHATLGAYLLAAILAHASGDPLHTPVMQTIERAIEFSMLVAQPDGRVPAIGGADDGKPIRMEHCAFWDFRSYQALGAALFGRGDFKYAAGRFHEDAFWLLGVEGREGFERVDASAPAGPSRALEHSGYYTLRSGWSSGADYVLFDCGEQAHGVRTDAIPSAAHGHADCLSLVLWLGGRPVLVDPGFYCYNLDPAWEVFFRKTEAHSTARVDGRDQSRHMGKMAWSHGFTPRLEGHQLDTPEPWVSGSHDGYARVANGVRHRRTVWLRPHGALVIYDEFTGSGEHLIELNFQFAPGTIRLEETSAYLNDVQIGWAVTGGEVEAHITPGGASERPECGWIATSLGVREPAPRLRLQMSMNGGRAACVTAIADCAVTRGAARLRSVPQRADVQGIPVLGIATPTGLEWIVGGHGTAMTAGPFATDAVLAAFRGGANGATATWAAGTYAHLDESRADLAGLGLLAASTVSRG